MSDPTTAGAAAAAAGTSQIMTPALQEQVLTALILMGVTSVVGSLGNLLVIAVYAKKRDSQTANMFIFMLAIVDFVTCSVIIPMTSCMEALNWQISSAFFCHVYHFLNTASVTFSSLLISAVAVDRYLCICHPFSRVMTVRRAQFVVLSLWLTSATLGSLSTTYASLSPVHRHWNSSNDNGSGGDGASAAATASAVSISNNNNISELVQECWDASYYVQRPNVTEVERVLNKIIQFSNHMCFMVCILCVLVLYVLIYHSVVKVRRRRKHLRGSMTTKEKRTQPTTTQQPPTSAAAVTPPISPSQICTMGPDLSQGSGAEDLTMHALAPTTPVPSPLPPPPLLLPHNNHHHPSPPMNQSGEAAVDEEEGDCSLHLIDVHLPPPALATTSTSTGSGTPHPHHSHPPSGGSNSQKQSRLDRAIGLFSSLRSQTRGERNGATVQNVKTAAMLFVVAIVFLLTFSPALLMASKLVNMNLVVFYFYYVNNAANPIIYSLMNTNFRADVVLLFIGRGQPNNRRRGH